jgi:hypothetical protein
VVAPCAADLQIARCYPDAREAVLLEHSLRGDVVDERARLESMQAELRERDLDQRGDGSGGESASVPRPTDPVTEVGAPERTADDVRESDRSSKRVVGEDRVQMLGTCDPLALRLRSEEVRRLVRYIGGEERPIRDEELGQALGVPWVEPANRWLVGRGPTPPRRPSGAWL